MKIKCGVATRYHGSKVTEVIEVPDEELEGKSENEKDEIICSQYLSPWVWENIDSWYEPVE